ncbi:UNVERIFIED_CONTAM: hypothetical protein Sindi_2929900 [Sesamum indicum]
MGTPIEGYLVAVEGNGLHTSEECRHLKNEIERFVQKECLQDYICWQKARGTWPYQKQELEKDKPKKGASPKPSIKETLRSSIGGRLEVNDPPHKGVIRMITSGPIGGDSQRLEKPKYGKHMD